VRLHAGTGATVATVKLLGAPSLPPGTEGFAALTLREPLVLAAGDRVLLRALSPEITVAGGTVLAASVPTALKDTPELVARLEHARSALPDVLAAACWAGPELSFTLAEARRLTQLPNATASEKVAEAVRAGLLVDLGEECLMVAQRVTELAAPLRKTLARFHAAHRLSVGMEPAQACAALGLPSGCFPRLAELIAGHGCAERHGRLALADFAPPVSAALAAQRDRLLAHLAAAGVNAPARGNLLKELALDEKDLDTLTKLLVEEGAIRLIGANLMPTAVFDDCRAKLLALFAKSPTVELAAFRAATGLSRNLGVGVLELFDREGLTRREGLARVLARKS
jgi:selenocysteine-specific elongation factor